MLLVSHSRWFVQNLGFWSGFGLKGCGSGYRGSKKDRVAAFRGHFMLMLNHNTRYVVVLIRLDVVQMSLQCCQSLLCLKGSWQLLCFVVAGAVGRWICQCWGSVHIPWLKRWVWFCSDSSLVWLWCSRLIVLVADYDPLGVVLLLQDHGCVS